MKIWADLRKKNKKRHRALNEKKEKIKTKEETKRMPRGQPADGRQFVSHNFALLFVVVVVVVVFPPFFTFFHLRLPSGPQKWRGLQNGGTPTPATTTTTTTTTSIFLHLSVLHFDLLFQRMEFIFDVRYLFLKKWKKNHRNPTRLDRSRQTMIFYFRCLFVDFFKIFFCQKKTIFFYFLGRLMWKDTTSRPPLTSEMISELLDPRRPGAVSRNVG